MSEVVIPESFPGSQLPDFEIGIRNRFLSSGEDSQLAVFTRSGRLGFLLAAELCRALTVENPKSRILILIPKSSMAWDFLDVLEDSCGDITDLHELDRSTFREFETNALPGQSPWPENAVLVTSFGRASDEYLLKPLLAGDWDLVIFCESHHVSASGSLELVRQFSDEQRINSNRFLVHSSKWDSDFDQELVAYGFRVERDDFSESPQDPISRRSLNEIPYLRSSVESLVFKKIESALPENPDYPLAGDLQRYYLSRLSSSVLMFERGYNQLWNRIAARLPKEEFPGENEFWSESMGVAKISELDQYPAEQLRNAMATIFFGPLDDDELKRLIDSIPSDSKQEAFVNFVESLKKKGPDPWGICICTQFPDMVTYLASALEFDLELSVTKPEGTSQHEVQLDTLEERSKLVLVSDDDLPLSDLTECRLLIHYDVPADPGALKARRSAISGSEGAEQIDEMFFHDEAESIAFEQNVLTAHGFLME